MTTSDEVRRADQQYNAALTALDRAVVDAAQKQALTGEAADICSALMVFLQQITAFVESKDRAIVADAGARMAAIEARLEAIAELRTQLAVVQRRLGSAQASQASLSRRSSAQPSEGGLVQTDETARLRSAAPSFGEASDYKYVAFEDQFRGSDAAIAEKVRRYVPIFAAAGGRLVVDLGCGRGELLGALRDAGVTARGVDANADMAAIARERGLDAVCGDALAFVDALDDESLGGIVATQVVEHLEPPYLTRLLDAAARKLAPGAPIVLETINPACWLAFFSSYIRDLTHVRPIHPETLQYLLRASGFERVELRYSAPVPDHMKMQTIDLPAGLAAGGDPAAAALHAIAHTINANAVILNNLMFTHLDYAAVGYRV